VTDLTIKAKQVEYLIKSLPEPEPEEVQVFSSSIRSLVVNLCQNLGKTTASVGTRREYRKQ
jgi:hypothetical protein